MGPKYSDIYRYKRESKEILHTGEEKKEEEAMGNVTKEAGIGTMQPQTKELTTATKRCKRERTAFPEASGRRTILLTC